MANGRESREKAEDNIPEKKSDSIEIPVGKWFGGMRNNPWMPAAIALAVVLILVLIFKGGGGGATGNVVSGDTAGNNLIGFINSQGQGTAELSSIEEKDGFYEATVNYNGQDIPVFVTLDGKYLISSKIPLAGGAADASDTGTATAEPVDVQIGDSPSEGNKDALVTIVEFTDFQCPYCGKYYTETYSQIKENYIDTGKVFYAVKNFPLSFHENAQKAAEAALCVKDQKGDAGYFKMHDKLFSNQDSLSIDNYKKWAREIGAVGSKFDTCLDSGQFADAVKQDLAYGQSIGVQGTPAFFINGVLLSGAQPYSNFQSAIEAALTAAG